MTGGVFYVSEKEQVGPHAWPSRPSGVLRGDIYNLGFTRTAIRWNEKDMHENIMRCYDS